MDLRDLMTLAGLVNPELLNKLQPTAEPECGCGSMEEEADGADQCRQGIRQVRG